MIKSFVPHDPGNLKKSLDNLSYDDLRSMCHFLLGWGSQEYREYSEVHRGMHSAIETLNLGMEVRS